MRLFVYFLISLLFSSGVYSQTISPAGPIDLCPGGSQVLSVVGGSPSSWQWFQNAVSVGGGSTYAATTSGSYTVVINGGGPGDTLGPVIVTTHPNPVAAFSFSPNNQCGNVPIQFLNLSTGTGLSYSWDFGDLNSVPNNTSTAANPFHHFIGNPGTGTQSFPVSLTATSSFGCSATTTNSTVTIKQAPDLTLGGPGATIYNNLHYFKKCSSGASTAQFDFTNLSTTAATNTSYHIVFGNATPDYISTTFTTVSNNYSVGTYTLLFIVGGPNGCIDTATYYIFVGSNPAVGLGNPGNTAICTSSTLTFPISSTSTNPPGTIYTVTFNDGTAAVTFPHPAPADISHNFLTTSCGTNSPGYPNSFSATIQASNPCASSTATVVPIYVSQMPEAAFTIAPRDTICVNQVATFTNTSGASNDIDNGTCIPSKFVWTITPATGWTVSSGIPGNDFGLVDPTTWQTGSTNLAVNFTTPGTYTIKLKLGNLTCGKDSVIHTICVNPLPTGSFSVNQFTGCAPLTVNTISSTNIPVCGVNRYVWTVNYVPTSGCLPAAGNYIFLNGTNASSAQPQFQFNDPGVYTIGMIVIGPAAACSSPLVTQVITVKSKPTVTLNPIASICVGSAINPTATVTNCGTSALTYNWSFSPNGSPISSTIAVPGPITYNTAGPQTVLLGVGNECGTSNVGQPFTVNNVTTSTAGPAQTLCGNTVTMTANVATTGTGTWTQLIGPNTASITSSNSPTTTITGLIPGTYVFTWTINNSGCSSSSNVTINISAGPTPANAGTDIGLCQQTSATLNANTPAVGTGVWTQTGGPAATISTPGSPTTTVTGLTTGVYTFQWTTSFSNCTPSTDNVQVTIYQNPSVAVAGNDQLICSATTTMAANAAIVGTGTWIQVSGATATITTPTSPTTTITGLTPGVYVFRWQISNGPCVATLDDVQVTVTNIPTTASAGTDQSLCAVTSATLAGNTALSGTGQWAQVSGPNTAVITNAALPNTTITGLIPGAYIFSWTIGNGTCPSTSDNVQITVYANATISNAGPAQTLCGTTVTMAANAAVVGTGLWTQLSGPAAVIATPSSPITTITGLTPGAYVFQWKITNGACSSVSTVNITISTGPTASNAGPDQDLCLANSATLAANNPTTGTGQWSIVSGTATITSPLLANTTVTGLTVGTYVFRWTTSFSNCSPSIDDVQIRVFDNPTTAIAGNDQVICSPTATMAANAAVVGTGSWTQLSGPASTITTAASPTTTITGLTPGTYIFRWRILNGPCPATEDDIQITVTDIPTMPIAGADQSLCAVTSATLAGNTALSGTGTWTQITGPNSAGITNPALPNTTVTALVAGNYVFSWTIGNGVCPSNSDNVQVSVYDNATVANAGPAQIVCGTSITMAANTAVVGTGLWTQISGLPATIITASSPTTTITGLTPGAYVFQWRITNGACSSASTVNITISTGPTPSIAGPDQDLCLATSTTLAANNPATGTGQWTIITGTAIITNPTLPNTTVTGLAVGTYIFRWTTTFSNCTPTTDDVQIRVFDNPTVAAAGPDQNICLPNTTLAANTAAIGNGQWTQLSGPNTATITNNTFPATTITGLIPGTYVFTWTINNGPCPASTDNVQVIYSTLSNNVISGSSAICINTAPATITGSIPSGSVAPYLFQWQSSPDGITWANIPAATSQDYSPGVLTATTCYRRIVTTTLCSGPQGAPSNTLCITVNPDARALFTASSTLLCAPVNLDTIISVTAFPLQNQQYNWYHDGILIPGTVNGLPPSYIIATPGQTVLIKLVTTSPFGCKPDSMSITFNTRPSVTANFIKDTAYGCGPLAVTFTNTSTILNNTIEFYWDFGNGITLSNVMQPPAPIIYAASPEFRDTTYYITLKAFSGCDTTYKRDSVKIFANPHASFTALTIGCSPFPDTIYNTSLGQDAFTTYYWDFGDGTFDTTYTTGSLYHTYITGIIDTFRLQLIMVNRCASDTQALDVIVSPSNIVEHIVVNGPELYGCAPHTVNFQNSSVGASILYWDFGDGSPIEAVPATQAVITHTYLTGSVYTVHITLENYCSDTTVDKTVTVYDRPIATFTLLSQSICTGNSVTTNNTSANANSYEWFWGDNTSTAGFNATHIYPTGGTYFVTLVARRLNSLGIVCTDTSAPVQVDVIDRIPAVVNISTATNPCVPYTITVTAANAAAASQIDWYFYDSNTAPGIFHVAGPTASYIYNFDGVDSVKLVITNGAGCKDSTVKQFIVHKTPAVIFTPINIKTCNTDTTASFNVSVNYSGTDPVNYEWYVNDILSGNSNPFVYHFQVPGGITAVNIFTIKVLVKNSFGCGDTTSLGNFIIQTLGPRHIVVSPSLVQEQPHYTFSFTDTAQVLPSSTYLWYTGDRNNQQLPGKDITYTYGDTGIYHVKLWVHDYETGCSSYDSVNVFIIPVPGYLYVPNAFCPGCHKAELRQFLPLAKGLKDYHLTIYNIWGKKVFETTSLDANGVPNQPWDGNWTDGQNMQQGAFSWYIEAHYINGTEWKGMLEPKTGKLKKQGFVTIIR